MKISGRTLIPITAALALCAAVLPLFETTSNCGGNSAALTAVGAYALAWRVEATEDPNRPFDIKTLTPTERQRAGLRDLPGRSWIHRAHFLVSTAPLKAREIPARRIIIVCDMPFTNVPQHKFWSAPPTHAAGYSDGTAGLITLSEYAALDRSTFVNLDEVHSEPSR